MDGMKIVPKEELDKLCSQKNLEIICRPQVQAKRLSRNAYPLIILVYSI
jgi:hypothetical protein